MILEQEVEWSIEGSVPWVCHDYHTTVSYEVDDDEIADFLLNGKYDEKLFELFSNKEEISVDDITDYGVEDVAEYVGAMEDLYEKYYDDMVDYAADHYD